MITDLRRNKKEKELKRNAFIGNILFFIKKNWGKLLISLLISFVIFFPQTAGNIIGYWFNIISNAIINNITF